MARAIGIAVFGALAVSALTGCARNQFKLTECVGGTPVVERTLDVAPPNCEG